MKSSWLSKKYFHKFKTDPKRTVKGFRIDAVEDVMCNISINQAARAKKLAILKLQGDPSAQYALLWDYADEVKRSNPGSTVILGTNQNLFDRFYVCLHALRMNFLAGCRPVICVDGCHLKGPHGGVLLAAVGIDPNNNFFPICYAVVMRENREIWEWFLTLLKMDLHIENDCNYTFMSDKQKGLVGALQELFLMQNIGEDIEKYTHQCYRVQTYLKAYQHPIFPINGRDEWKKSDLSPPVPPKPVKRVGRPPNQAEDLK
ncbi:hypothetical protein Sango_2642400 [Sesamum angolense]|uniref:MULE transposase domain-containing protein n=1 Tax=Sesamum angolense TaxID=2727404 RepID=A0AAE1W1V9_9LAMI|nr:hypothetical protein Sango_2642400 [Sesamum angolense]